MITEQTLDEFIASGTTGFVDAVKILFPNSLSFQGPDLTFPLQFTLMYLPGNIIIFFMNCFIYFFYKLLIVNKLIKY